MAKIAKSRLGRYVRCSVAGESYKAFLPPPLPPVPPIDYASLHGLFSRAVEALTMLDGATDNLPDTSLLLYFYVRQEAVLSSQIEGTQSTIEDFLLHESNEETGVPIDDVAEVSSYVAALKHGMKRVRGGFPLSLRLIREMHAILLAEGRGQDKRPGEFRQSQNWIGGSRPGNAIFVPPPAERLMEFLDPLEKYFHLEKRVYASLIDAAMIHVQFETIHPFLDGNGRIGRLLITFFLLTKGTLRSPVLYLSLYFKNNRSAYYERLNAVRLSGDWEGWLEFFLTGVFEVATQAVKTSHSILKLFESDSDKIANLKRAEDSARQAHILLKQKAIVNVMGVAKDLNVSIPTARSAVKNLESLGIVSSIRGKGRSRIYIYRNLIDLLNEGIDPDAD